MQQKPLILALLAGLTLSGAGQATLIDRGGGLIYDNVLDITWLSDANYAKTSGYDADGQMNWTDANAWAASLSYGGFDDWRLPTALNADGTGPCAGYNCTGSEMGHLYYGDLGGTAGGSLLISSDSDLAKFINIQGDAYWSGTEFALSTDDAWHFFTDIHGGGQGVNAKWQELYAWAVRDGDVAAVPSGNVPEPATLALLGLGLAGLGVMRRRG